MQEYSVLGGKCPGESKKKLGGFCPWWKMSRRIEKKTWEEIVLGGKFPGGLKIYLGGICD